MPPEGGDIQADAVIVVPVHQDDVARQRGNGGADGGALYYRWEVEPSLLAGVRIQVGDDVKDGSVRSRIDRLAAMARTLSN